MEIEQLPPNKPNFLFILYLFGGTIIVLFILALIFLHWDGKHITFRHTHTERTQLVVPAAPTQQLSARV